MKRIMRITAVMLTLTLVSASNANLVQNGGFDNGNADWNSSGQWGSPYFYVDGSDAIVSLGGWGDGVSWSNASVWQNTGSVFAADTLYTLDVVWRDPSDGGLDIENIQLSIIDAGTWVDATSGLYGPAATVDEWNASTLTLDTTSKPALVGKNIGVGVRLTSPTGAWLHIDSVTLVPEPATVIMLGMGALAIRKKRKI